MKKTLIIFVCLFIVSVSFAQKYPIGINDTITIIDFKSKLKDFKLVRKKKYYDYNIFIYRIDSTSYKNRKSLLIFCKSINDKYKIVHFSDDIIFNSGMQNCDSLVKPKLYLKGQNLILEQTKCAKRRYDHIIEKYSFGINKSKIPYLVSITFIEKRRLPSDDTLPAVHFVYDEFSDIYYLKSIDFSKMDSSFFKKWREEFINKYDEMSDF